MDGIGGGLSGKQVGGGTIKVVCTQERGNKPYWQVEDKLWFKRLDGEGDSATGTQLICGIISCAEHRNNFCNAGALVDSHKMKAAFKVQFTFPLGLNEILTGVETEESPTHSRGRSSRKFYYYGLLLPVQRTKSFTFPIKLQGSAT